MTEDNRIDSIVIPFYAVLLVIYGMFNIFSYLAQEGYVSLPYAANWIHVFFAYTGITLYGTPFNFIIGYGLIKRRAWARYGAIAVMFTIAIHTLSQAMWWGSQSLASRENAYQLLFAGLTLTYLYRKQIRHLFGEEKRFRIKSRHGVLVGFILLFPLLPIITAVYFKAYYIWKYDEPLFISTPEVISLKKPDKTNLSRSYTEVELLDIRLLVPEGFTIRGVQHIKDNNDVVGIGLWDGKNKNGFMILGNRYELEDIDMIEGIKDATKLSSAFEIKKYLHTNNWNPGVATIRLIATPHGDSMSVKEVHINDTKGFVRTWKRGARLFAGFSLFSGDESRYAGGTIAFEKKIFDEDDILSIVSSVEFMSPGRRSAEDYYRRGMEYYSQHRFVSAQFEFANAYYRNPDNPEFIYMLAKSLSRDDFERYEKIAELLDIVLKLDPGHTGAKKLLKEIEPELSRELTILTPP